MFFTSFTIMYYPEKENLPLKEEVEGCAGIIATGSGVKDGRSILWKNRHSSLSEDNKVWYEQGTNYSYIRITDLIGCWMGTNEEGLSIANVTTPRHSCRGVVTQVHQ